MLIEVVVYNIESALMAQMGGADRLELCDNPGEGGTTPSLGTIETVRRKVNIDLFVMVRPRGGDFLFSDDEFDAIKKDIMAAKRAGADGIVTGILKKSGEIDVSRCKELIQLARPMQVTCHRAFDMAKNHEFALEDCIVAGFDRILTSGGKTKAVEGVDLIKKLVKQSNGRIAIMAGSGINPENAFEIVKQSGITEIHMSGMTHRESPMEFQNQFISGMGSAAGSEYKLRTVDSQQIRDTRNALSSVNN